MDIFGKTLEQNLSGHVIDLPQELNALVVSWRSGTKKALLIINQMVLLKTISPETEILEQIMLLPERKGETNIFNLKCERKGRKELLKMN